MFPRSLPSSSGRVRIALLAYGDANLDAHPIVTSECGKGFRASSREGLTRFFAQLSL